MDRIQLSNFGITKTVLQDNDIYPIPLMTTCRSRKVYGFSKLEHAIMYLQVDRARDLLIQMKDCDTNDSKKNEINIHINKLYLYNTNLKMHLISDLRKIIYEYVNILTIPDFYDYDTKIFDKIIEDQGIDLELDFSLMNLHYLKKNFVSMNINIDDVVETGNLKMLEWLLENKQVFTTKSFAIAAYNNDFATMCWLKENNCMFDENTVKG
jgi:hypothetical protein